MGSQKRRFIGLVVVVSCIAACTATDIQNGAVTIGSAPPPPRYLGIYADDGNGLTQITYNRSFEDTMLSVRRPVFYTYGIDLNAGLLAPMDPRFTVGLELRDHPRSHFDLEIELIDHEKLYLRYSLREGFELPDNDYTFYIRERFGGTKAVRAVFRVTVPATNTEEQ